MKYDTGPDENAKDLCQNGKELLQNVRDPDQFAKGFVKYGADLDLNARDSGEGRMPRCLCQNGSEYVRTVIETLHKCSYKCAYLK